MEWRRDKDLFDEVVDTNDICPGSTYAAVRFVAREARKKLKETNNQIQDSEAISWALTGIAPEIHNYKEKYTEVYYSRNKLSAMNDILSCVDDPEVCESVRQSIKASDLIHHLIYCYHPDIDEYRQARVRILSKMIWDRFNSLYK